MTYKDLFSTSLPTYKSERTDLKFYYRPNTSDIKTIMEVVERNVYQKKYFKIDSNEHWIDLGGNIGAFTVLVASLGSTVDVYEPCKEHCNLIEMNLKLNGLNANIINKAVVFDDRKETEFYININGNTWRNSIVKNWKSSHYKVDCVNFKEVLNSDSCCKMDIEGAEMEILERLDFPLKKLVAEWSFDIDNNIDRYRNVVSKLRNIYKNVHASEIKSEHKVWLKSWFPPCKNIYCY